MHAATRYPRTIGWQPPVWRFGSPHHFCSESEMRTSEPKLHEINKLLVSFDPEVRKRGGGTMRTSASGRSCIDHRSAEPGIGQKRAFLIARPTVALTLKHAPHPASCDESRERKPHAAMALITLACAIYPCACGRPSDACVQNSGSGVRGVAKPSPTVGGAKAGSPQRARNRARRFLRLAARFQLEAGAHGSIGACAGDPRLHRRGKSLCRSR